MTLESDAKFEEKLAHGLKNDMTNLVNFGSGKSENLYFDGIFLSKVCIVWAKMIQASCVVKIGLWFQKWDKGFVEFSHK